ncbi:hypothetical protein IVA80_30560 [Bradyrhizobium sp. 139]|nr:hypothetical protein [Bradyrhizobium sp. 139]
MGADKRERLEALIRWYRQQLRTLRSRSGRVIRDVRRETEGRPVPEHAWPATQIHSQQQRQRGWKDYSFHASEV